jgi:hypothetical protein
MAGGRSHLPSREIGVIGEHLVGFTGLTSVVHTARSLWMRCLEGSMAFAGDARTNHGIADCTAFSLTRHR